MNANDFPHEFPQEQKARREVVPVGGCNLLLKDEVYHIVGCAMEVLNELDHGLNEKPYENAILVEFGLREIPFVQQPRFNVHYKGVSVGEYVPDLIAFTAVVVDMKVIDAITDHERGQMLNYLRINRP